MAKLKVFSVGVLVAVTVSYSNFGMAHAGIFASQTVGDEEKTGSNTATHEPPAAGTVQAHPNLQTIKNNAPTTKSDFHSEPPVRVNQNMKPPAVNQVPASGGVEVEPKADEAGSQPEPDTPVPVSYDMANTKTS